MSFNSLDRILYPLQDAYPCWRVFNHKLFPSLLDLFVVFLFFNEESLEDLILDLQELLLSTYFFRRFLCDYRWSWYIDDRFVMLLIYFVVRNRVQEIGLEIDEVDGSLYHLNTVSWSFWQWCNGLNNLNCTLFNSRKLSSSISSSLMKVYLFDSWLLKSSTSLARNG